jgi:hypothetical protein
LSFCFSFFLFLLFFWGWVVVTFWTHCQLIRFSTVTCVVLLYWKWQTTRRRRSKVSQFIFQTVSKKQSKIFHSFFSWHTELFHINHSNEFEPLKTSNQMLCFFLTHSLINSQFISSQSHSYSEIHSFVEEHIHCSVSLIFWQHSKTQHNTTQHNTTQHNTTQHNTTQHNTTQHNTTQHNTTQHNRTQPVFISTTTKSSIFFHFYCLYLFLLTLSFIHSFIHSFVYMLQIHIHTNKQTNKHIDIVVNHLG